MLVSSALGAQTIAMLIAIANTPLSAILQPAFHLQPVNLLSTHPEAVLSTVSQVP